MNLPQYSTRKAGGAVSCVVHTCTCIAESTENLRIVMFFYEIVFYSCKQVLSHGTQISCDLVPKYLSKFVRNLQTESSYKLSQGHTWSVKDEDVLSARVLTLHVFLEFGTELDHHEVAGQHSGCNQNKRTLQNKTASNNGHLHVSFLFYCFKCVQGIYGSGVVNVISRVYACLSTCTCMSVVAFSQCGALTEFGISWFSVNGWFEDVAVRDVNA